MAMRRVTRPPLIILKPLKFYILIHRDSAREVSRGMNSAAVDRHERPTGRD